MWWLVSSAVGRRRTLSAAEGCGTAASRATARIDVSHPRSERNVRTRTGEASERRPAAFGLAGRKDLGTSASGGSEPSLRRGEAVEATMRFEP